MEKLIHEWQGHIEWISCLLALLMYLPVYFFKKIDNWLNHSTVKTCGVELIRFEMLSTQIVENLDVALGPKNFDQFFSPIKWLNKFWIENEVSK